MSNICDDLRAAILQAAMQGKLTQCNASDDNVEELCNKIVKERSAYKPNKFVEKQNDDITIPDEWRSLKSGEVFGERREGARDAARHDGLRALHGWPLQVWPGSLAYRHAAGAGDDSQRRVACGMRACRHARQMGGWQANAPRQERGRGEVRG